MSAKPIIFLIFTTSIIAACGIQTPQPTPVPATATQALSSPTETIVPATNTLIPATDTPIPTTEISTTEGISFSNDVFPIFKASCNKCHGIEQVKEGLDMTTYEGLMAGSFNGLVITAGNANDSYLVQQIIEGEMPKRGPGLTDAQIQLISDWVNQGAQNN